MFAKLRMEIDKTPVRITHRNPIYLALIIKEGLNQALASYENNVWLTALMTIMGLNPLKSLLTEMLQKTMLQAAQTLPSFSLENSSLLLNGPTFLRIENPFLKIENTPLPPS